MRFLIHRLDDLIRLSIGVFEFNLDPNNLLRLQVGRASHLLQLPDGNIESGEPVLLIHLWNERLPRVPPGGVNLAWAASLLRRFSYSLQLTAGYLRESPCLEPICAVGGETILLTSGVHGSGSRFIRQMGFTVLPCSGPLGRFGEFWENFYSWLMIWAFNPGSLPDRSLFLLRRSEMWISRQAFLARYN